MTPTRALTLLLLATAAAGQDLRYKVTLNDGVATFTPNGARIAVVSSTREAGLTAGPVTVASPQPSIAPSTLTVDLTPRPEAATLDRPAGRGPGTSTSADDAVASVDDAPPAGPLWEAYRERAANTYLVTDADEQLAGWRYFQRERRLRPALAQETRISNAVIDMILSLDRAPKGDSRARPDELADVRPGRSLKVRAGSGIVSRRSPYGEFAATRYAVGEAVPLTGQRSGPWYEVEATPRHWVCGLWLEFK